MQLSKTVFSNILVNILNGAKIPHSTSQPVIYQESGKYNRSHFVQLDADQYVGGKLEEKLTELFG